MPPDRSKALLRPFDCIDNNSTTKLFFIYRIGQTEKLCFAFMLAGRSTQLKWVEVTCSVSWLWN